MSTTEYHHNSPEQVRGYLEAALREVVELDPPEDLRVAVFTKSLDLLSAKQLVIERLAPSGIIPPGIKRH